MWSNRIGTRRVCKLSSVILTAIIHFVVIATTLIWCHELSPRDHPKPLGRVAGEEKTPLELEPDDYDQYTRNNINQTISKGMRELIRNDETLELGLKGFVVKWSKYGMLWGEHHKTVVSDHNLPPRRRKLDSKAATNAQSECGRGFMPRYPTKNRSLFTNKYTIASSNRTTLKSQHNGNKRIYDGYIASKGSFPWVAQLKIFGGGRISLCSASIVSEWLIFTAAHCIARCKNGRPEITDPGSLSALLGRHEISWWAINIAGSDTLFRAMIMPTGLDPCALRFEQDYVLLVTAKKMNLDDETLASVCLPDRDDIRLEDVPGVLVGWGESYRGGGRSNELRWSRVQIKPKDYCLSVRPHVDPSKTLCAVGDKSACSGDSGGPLMIRHEVTNRWLMVGSTSAYIGPENKCESNMILLFHRISAFWKKAIEELDINELIKLKNRP